MSYRSSFSTAYGGRGSPFSPRIGLQDRSFSDLFEYVDPNDVSARGPPEPSSAMAEDEDAPDVLHMKYMGSIFKLSFPPYSISESGVTVQEVRRRVAEGLQQDSRRVRLVYKDRELMTDHYAIKRYGCKQNSEIAIVVTEQLNDWGASENQHSSGDDSGSGSSLRVSESRRPRGMSTVRYRVEEVPRSNDNRRSAADASGYLHPNGSAHHHHRRRSNSPGRPVETSSKSADKMPSAPRPISTPVLPRAPPADPNTPMGKVQALQDQFYDKWLPQSQQFLAAPPSDKTQRDREYRMITEMIMKHIVEAADAIELQGDQDARAERKKVIGDANEMLRKLDAVPKLS